MMGLPLGPDSSGEPVRDLQHRLADIGYDLGPDDEPGRFGPSTEARVRHFQEQRGLPVTGRCDALTWTSLVEASYRLGDRPLYLRAPMLRGDDVAELQRRLNALGFDAGRVDGIFGPNGVRALTEFQRNMDLPPDGICGPDSVAALERVSRGPSTSLGVFDVRERERLRQASRRLSDQRLTLGHPGGLDVIVSAIARRLQRAGALVAVLQHPDGSVQAQQANEFHADLHLGLTLVDEPSCVIAYYAGPGYRSPGGERLAQLIERMCVPVAHKAGLGTPSVRGMRLPVLRETRMPAVLVELGPPRLVVNRGAPLAGAISEAVLTWVSAPIEPA